jgi:protein involved in polysaccharide export with SLBB domain
MTMAKDGLHTLKLSMKAWSPIDAIDRSASFECRTTEASIAGNNAGTRVSPSNEDRHVRDVPRAFLPRRLPLWALLCLLSVLSLFAVTPAALAQQDSSSPLLYPPPSDDTSTQPSRSQTVAPQTPSPQTSSSFPSTSSQADGLNSPLTSNGTLSASQIITILQQNPDALAEVKQLASDAASQQGQSVSAESITDEMLFSRIQTNAELRSNITVFLRSRGYVNDSDIDMGDDAMSSLASTKESAEDGSSQNQSSDKSTKAGRDSPQTREEKGQVTPELKVIHRKTPYNLLALHDLYTQVTDEQAPLKRFGADMFLHRDDTTSGAMSSSTSLDVPVDSTYILGPGDSLTVQMWGGLSQTINRTVDREGFLTLPEAGQIQVAGMTLDRAQAAVASALQRQYRNLQVAITLSHLRSIRIYVVGDVQRPGSYEVSVLSSPVSALYAAGGPTSVGSLRILRQYRGTRLINEIDLYDFLLHGVQNEARLQAGDTLLVPPAGSQVAVSGAIRRPAIYELKGNTSLKTVLEDAGATTVSAELAHITIDRVKPNQQRETVDLRLSSTASPDEAREAITAFSVQDGDRVRVSPIQPYSQKVIYTEGHVLRPGRLAWHDGMYLSDVLATYRDVLPEPADRGEIVRLMAPDLHVETIEFSVPDLMIGNINPALQPFDTIRVFGRYGADAPRVVIGGEVLHPGTYPLSNGMTASQLVRVAGGFTRAALLANADLTSYSVVNGASIEGQRVTVRIGDAVEAQDKTADVSLKAGDVLNIHKLTGWDDIGATIVIQGEIAHPGRYGFQQGERLSSVLKRAGGFRPTSYPDGAVLIRPEVKVLEEKSRQELIRQIETSSSAARLAPSVTPGDTAGQLQLVKAQQEQILGHLKSEPVVGRLVIRISSDISSWENTPADIEVRAGDVLRIPKKPGFVLVSGQVYNSSAITFAPGQTAGWYLRRAGGSTEVANRKEIFVIRANGSVVGRESGAFFHHDVLATRLDAGDVVVVPQKIIGASLFWRNLLTVAQIASSITITAAVAGVL